ncbi:MAG: aldo/keto reductase [Maricaulaceae bacterium]|nr:aldo/keto reductase [Maricaulaceae bacterium]
MSAYRLLGRTGAKVSSLGFGVSGPHASPAVSRAATITLVRRAVELGVTAFDTGPSYGDGEAERRLGAALKGLERDRLFVITKAGVSSNGGAGRRMRDFSPDGIERSLLDSLGRLGLDQADALMLHGPSPGDLTPALLDRVDALKARGLLRFTGVCGRGAELDAAIDTGRLDLLMAPLNAGLPAAALARFARAKAAGIGVIGIEAMSGARRDVRAPASLADLWYLARSVKQVVTGAAPAAATTDPAEALAWALGRPDADCVLIQTTRLAHLEANARSAALDPAPAPA